MTTPRAITMARANGWSIIPASPDKRPLLKSWKPLQNRLPTDAELVAWANLEPPAWAVITGAVSGVIVLDFDGSGGRRTLEALDLQPHVRTGSGGHHVYFEHPGWTVPTLNSRSKRELGARWPGLDIRGDGGYACFAGHNRSGAYTWLRDATPDRLDRLTRDLRAFLGLLHAPQPESKRAGTQRVAPSNGYRVDAGRMLSRALDTARAEGRNDAGFWLAAQLRDNGYTESEAKRVMRDFANGVMEINQKGHHEPYTEREALASLRQAYSRPAREPWPRRHGKQPASGQSREREFHQTDLGNAERLIERHGEDLLYCGQRDCWFIWDTRRWKLDEAREIDRLANETIRAAYAEAGRIEDQTARRKFVAFLFKSESNGALSAMALRPRSIAHRCEPEDLDRDPWLLNCPNGVVNLKTGKLMPHNREYLITRVAGAEYNAHATCPVFERFIHRIMGAHPDASGAELERTDRLVGYLQKVFGYCASGSVIEKAVFVAHGPGRNGKTTLLEIIRATLGDYAGTVLIDSLMTKQVDNSVNTDIADLRGRRFVSSSECDEGQRLAVARLKHLSGMGTLKARRLRENCFEFQPTHKLFLDTNHKPVIRGSEDATWDRLHCIPFTVTIPIEEQDKDLLAKMRAELPGILAWIVRGCQRWQHEGLERPAEVRTATDEYRQESDPLRDFIEDCCTLAPEAWVLSADLWRAYQQWAKDSGEKFPLNRKRFADCLLAKGLKADRISEARIWRGIGRAV